MIARIKPSEAEWKAHAFSSSTLDKASNYIRTDGALILEDIVDPSLILKVRENFLQRYDGYLNGGSNHDAALVGDRRLMITVDLEPPFDRRELVANSWLCPVLTAAFEGDFVLDAYGVVCSLPGAPRQHVHQDGGDIFPQAALNRLLPMVAVTVAIPLIEMNAMHGTTALWLGSHRDEVRSAWALEPSSAELGEEPPVREGSCVLWDYRLRHAGTANLSAVPRPLLYMTYCRPWFMDHKNYRNLTSLRAPEDFLKGLPEDLRRLLGRIQEHKSRTTPETCSLRK
jgi:ectoine hydroxylase-related dioxygenase (phytanoyl-CoA dioxygenase family)